MHCLRRWWAASALILVTALVAGCGFTGAGAGENALRLAIGIPPRSGWSPASDDALLLMRLGVTETLTDVDVEGNARPNLATSWERNGAHEWRFTLQEGVRFHSGEPLTAAAAAESLNGVVQHTTPPRTLRGIVAGAEVAGPRTLVIHTAEPDPILPLRMGGANTALIAPAAQEGDGEIDLGAGVGTGPFEVARSDGASGVGLNRFDEYHGAAAELDRADVRFVEDASARVNGLRSGEFDLIDKLPVSQLDEVRSDAGLTESTVELPRTTALHMNTDDGPFADRAVRAAAARAIDRPGIVDGVLQDRGVPATHYFGPAVPWSVDEPVPDGRPDEARQRLSDAAEDSGRVPITIGTYPDRPDLPAVTTVVADELERAGFDVRIVQEPSDQIETKALAGELDALVYSRNYLVDVPDAGNYLNSDFSCTGSLNLDRFCDPSLDGLLDSLHDVSDPEERGEQFRRADQLLADQVVGVPLFHEQDQVAHRTEVNGVPADPLERDLLTEEVSVE